MGFSTYTSGDGTSTLRILDLRTGSRLYRYNDYLSMDIAALAPDGRYIFEGLFNIGPNQPFDQIRLVAGNPGKPDVTLDEGGLGAFTDVGIVGGVAYWTNSGAARSAPLP